MLQSADKEHSVQMDSSLSPLRCDCRSEHVISPAVMFASIWYAKKLGRRLVQSSRKAKLLKDEVSLKECILYWCAGLGRRSRNSSFPADLEKKKRTQALRTYQHGFDFNVRYHSPPVGMTKYYDRSPLWFTCWFVVFWHIRGKFVYFTPFLWENEHAWRD